MQPVRVGVGSLVYHRRCPNLVTKAYFAVAQVKQSLSGFGGRATDFAARLPDKDIVGTAQRSSLKGREPMALAPDHRAKLVSYTLADKAVVAQERLGDFFGGHPVHVDLQVQLLHLLGGEERGDLAEQVRELLVLLVHLLAHG